MAPDGICKRKTNFHKFPQLLVAIMSEHKKNSLKRFELPINRFANVALPLYLDMLDKQQQNMSKLRKNQQWEKMRIEAMNASRTIQQLRAALEEMEAVRCQLEQSDQVEFDRQLSPHKNKAAEAIRKFDHLGPTQMPAITTDITARQEPLSTEHVQLQETLLPEEIEFEQRRIQFETWKSLQQDINDLHELFAEFSQNVQTQATAVDSVEQHVEVAVTEVEQGERYLAKAAKYKTAVYPLTGALLGTCIGGPVGLLAGLKIGGLAAIGGSLLGYTGGRALKTMQEKNVEGNMQRSQSVACCTAESIPPDPETIKKSPSCS